MQFNKINRAFWRLFREPAPTVHVGFTKAASTFLQAYFECHPDIHFPDRLGIYEHFAKNGDLLFNRAEAETYVKSEMEAANGRALVFSHERLSGCPHSGFYDCASIARSLCDVAKPRVIIVIREQYDMIASIYKEYVNNGGARMLLEYLYPPHDGRVPLFDWRPLRYIELISLYRELSGEKNVKIVLFEDMKSSSRSVIREISDFIGVKPMEELDALDAHKNPSPSDDDVELQRTKNITEGLLTTVSCERNVGGEWLRAPNSEIVPQDFLKRESFRDMLRHYIPASEFADTNRRLADLLKMDLSSHGYVM